MLVFDLEGEPPTRQDIATERERLQHLRRRAFRSGLISDGVHALILLSLYAAGVVSGRAFIIAVLVGTVLAMVLATGTGARLAANERILFLCITIMAGLVVGVLLSGYFSEPLPGGIIAGLATATITATGSLLGRRILQVLSSLEDLEPIEAEHPASMELATLCREYPQLAAYREQARDILRPFLTFGELKMMQVWARDKD